MDSRDELRKRFPDLSRKRFDWQRLLTIAIVVISLATAAYLLYRRIFAEMAPGEGDLIVNVNTATLKELETVPGIGPALSKQIIAGRPYERIEDLERVRGIGRYSLNSIRPYVKIEGETEER